MAQTRSVIEALSASSSGVDFQVVIIRTLGDRLPVEKRAQTDGKGAFTDDIESHLLRRDIDIAVHSLKDVSSQLSAGLRLGATPRRGDPRDALISSCGVEFSRLPRRAKLGTSSMRRKVQLLRLRPDLEIVEMRGNVETRIGKLGRSGVDGLVLAAAGLDRLSMGQLPSQRFEPEVVVPSAGQGTLAVEVRDADAKTQALVSRINDEATMRASECERAFIRAVGGDCSFPVGAYASANGSRSMTLTGMIASNEGDRFLKRTKTGRETEDLGRNLGEEMLQLGGAEILGSLAR